jgi:hypothetical protein
MQIHRVIPMERHIMKKLFMIAAAFSGLVTFSSAAEAKTARCDVSWFGSRYTGPCDFNSWKGGSFDVSLPEDSYEKYELPPYIVVNIIAPGRAKIGWATPTGKFQEPVEPARRDAKKPACWAAESMRICVY